MIGMTWSCFLQVITEEAATIQSAFEKAVGKAGKPVKIRLTMVVLQSNSNYRVFPADENLS